MNKLCIVSDFDGTITKKDGLYSFISKYADNKWESIEQSWTNGEISSKECLIEEFKLIPNMSEDLVSNFIETMSLDEYFTEFYNKITHKNIDFFIVSDGIDYFINRILEKYGIDQVNIISNHGEFKNGKFEISFPNDYPKCKNNSGTCKCKVISDLREKYEKIIYIGDGVSDFCVADKADILYAKSRLLTYCKENNIKFVPYNSFKDIFISE